MLGALLFATAAAAAAAPAPVLVSITLSASRASNGPDAALLSSTVSLRAPLSSPQMYSSVERLGMPLRGSSAYRDALADALTVGGTLSRADLDAFVGPSSGPGTADRRSSLRIAAGLATVKVTTDGIAGWRGARDGRTVTMQPHTVPSGSQLDVILRVARSRAATAQPVPTTQHFDHQLARSFPAGRTPRVKVGFEPALSHAGPRHARIVSSEVAAFLLLGLPFAAFLALNCQSPDPQRSMEVGSPERALRRLSLIGMALALSGSASFELIDHGGPNVRGLLAHVFGSPGVGFAAIALLALLPVVALADLRRRAWRWLLIIGVSAAFLVLLAYGLRVPATGSDSERTLWPCALASGMLATTLIFASVAALGRWLDSVAPELVEWWCSRVRPRWRRAILVVTALAATVQLLAASTHIGSATRAIAVLTIFAEVPPLLVNLVPIALSTILGVGLAWSVGRRTGAAGEPDLEDRAARVTLALLFTVVVIRKGGTIDGYPAPLAFGFGLLALTRVLREMKDRRRARLIGDPAVRVEAPDFLARAERSALLTRQRDALHDDLAAGRITEAAYGVRRASLETRLRSLADAPVLVEHGVPARRREGEVRALGLGGGQDLRARIATAGRSCCWLVALPIAYSWLQDIDRTGIDALSSRQSMGLLFLAARLVDEATVWTIALWCFVALFPIIPAPNGPVKALVAALAFAVPTALATPLIDHSLTPSGEWWFVSAELALLFAFVGVVLDYNAVRSAGGSVRELGDSTESRTFAQHWFIYHP